ncbi:hypothetical protein BpHYR1_042049 [Brachionus plicatilis]|uniref:Uncharacterized protein n=1 Tax=Brachionus plicatilis TaxID=10195 RepID=A0A3M7R114_BRAPC|nr:hypothetical protein BpHYR1_042049 [Brachionus plicatilis]
MYKCKLSSFRPLQTAQRLLFRHHARNIFVLIKINMFSVFGDINFYHAEKFVFIQMQMSWRTSDF